jgi:anti-anti-sigma factor
MAVLQTPVRPSAPDAGRLLSVTTLPGPRPGRVVVEVVGEVDAYTVPLLEACLRSHTAQGGIRELVVDLRQVTFVGAAGVGVLARAQERCRSLGARLEIRTGGRRRVLRPLALAGLVDRVAVDPAGAEQSRPGPRTPERPCTSPRRLSARRRTCAGDAGLSRRG